MPMVHIGEMPVCVDDGCVNVWMRVRLAAVPRKVVRMSMVFIVTVHVRMLHRQVGMDVFVTLHKMQPDP